MILQDYKLLIEAKTSTFFSPFESLFFLDSCVKLTYGTISKWIGGIDSEGGMAISSHWQTLLYNLYRPGKLIKWIEKEW